MKHLAQYSIFISPKDSPLLMTVVLSACCYDSMKAIVNTCNAFRHYIKIVGIKDEMFLDQNVKDIQEVIKLDPSYSEITCLSNHKQAYEDIQEFIKILS